MNIPPISEDIVKKRQEKAPVIGQMMETCGKLADRLLDVSASLQGLSLPDSPEMKNAHTEISRVLTELRTLRARAEIRHKRFQSGIITISIAGLEKAGKTTFLKSLTGIEDLPAFDERCTAVCCEIHYSQERSDFDIEFCSEQEFMERVIRPVTETIAAALPDSYEEAFAQPLSAEDFVKLRLPSPEALAAGTTAFKLLHDLRLLQDHFHECRHHLGKPPLFRRPLSELGQWVSHKRAETGETEPNPEAERRERGLHPARTAAVRVCRIYADFTGGSPHLRWMDTPGVDDPNRRARELTLAAIASETDLLAVVSRPGSSPSPGESFHHFWDSVSRQPDEIDLLSRMIFVLNCDKRVDPAAKNIRIHRKYLTDAGVPHHIFAGPFEAIKPEDAAALMDRVNAHLREHLAAQDEQVIGQFQTRVRHLQARLRLLHDALKKIHPSDAGLHDLETEEFHKWFHWYREGRDAGFWTDLVAALDRASRDIVEDSRIRESEQALLNVFGEEARRIQEEIPSAEVLEDYLVRHRGENPIPSAMRAISTSFSRLVNRLAGEVQEFGPVMQDRLVQVLSEAGLEPLLSGQSAGEKIRNLTQHLLSAGTAENANPVLEVLRETMELPRNLKYVIRYELRPAVDFCDPTLWNQNEDAWNRLTEMVRANGGDAEKLAKFAARKYPPVTESREKDQEMLARIAGNALLAVRTVLNNERFLPRRIADDYMRDCRVRLCFGPESEQEWRSLLFRTRSLLLSRVIGQIRSESKRIQEFHSALNRLETELP
ncbi:MAG: dynamin family protein [Desulfobacterales bacterium]